MIARARARAAGGLVHRAPARRRGRTRVLKKIGEEATEVVLAAKGESDERLAEECADLLFHLLVVLAAARRAARRACWTCCGRGGGAGQ